MTNHKCIDPKIGNMLHAYELDTLNDEELDLFEAHLMQCDYCFENLVSFEKTSDVLKSDSRIMAVVEERLKRDQEPTAKESIWRQITFPDITRILRPAFLLVIIILLIYPAYLGLVGNRDDISYLYPIGLSSFRSASIDNHEITADQGIVLSFACPNYTAEKTYAVLISNEYDNVIFDDDRFTNFDRYGIGRVYLPHDLLQSGLYLVEIYNTEYDESGVAYKFNLTVKK